MSAKKTICYAGLILFFAVLLLVGVGFMLASMRPADYHPYQLTKEIRQRQVAKFFNKHVAPFHNNYIKPEPFTHTLKQDEMNFYLASLDEIALQRPNKKGKKMQTGGVYEAMDKNGLADPVVKFADQQLTIMIRSKQHADKIITLKIVMDVDENGLLKISLDAVKVGRLPVPKSVVEESLAMLRDALKEDDDDDEFGSMENVISKVFIALDGEPVKTEFKIRGQVKKISDIKIADGMLKISYMPVRKN